MTKYWKYFDPDKGKEAVCVHSTRAAYDTLCGLDMNDEFGIGLVGEYVDQAVVTCPACIAIINEVMDLPVTVKRTARKSRAVAAGEGE